MAIIAAMAPAARLSQASWQSVPAALYCGRLMRATSGTSGPPRPASVHKCDHRRRQQLGAGQLPKLRTCARSPSLALLSQLVQLVVRC